MAHFSLRQVSAKKTVNHDKQSKPDSLSPALIPPLERGGVTENPLLSVYERFHLFVMRQGASLENL